MTKAPMKVQKITTDPAITNEGAQDKNLSLHPVKVVSVHTGATNNTTTKVRDVDTVKSSLEGSHLISNVDMLLNIPNIPRRSSLRTSTTSNESDSFKPREVSFDSISIRNYGMELGNHPNCQVGAPVTLSWDYEEQDTQDIDIYEFERKPRRRRNHLILNYYRRNDILKLAGYFQQGTQGRRNGGSARTTPEAGNGNLLACASAWRIDRECGTKVHSCRTPQFLI